MIKLLIGGSPCTKWSIAQKKDRETTAEGEGWELFLNYKIAKEKFKPDFFLYENNKSAAQAIKDQISMELGVPLMHINSALVSAQNRQRFYAFNWTVPQPEDRGILLRDILETGQTDKDKAYCLKHQAGNVRDYFKKHHTQVAFEPVGVGYRNRREDDGKLHRRFETDGDEKANALTTVVTDSMVAEPVAEPFGTTEDGKSFALTATYYKGQPADRVLEKSQRTMVAEPVAINGGDTMVAEPVKVGGMPRPNGEVSTAQAMRVYAQDGKSVTLSANGGGMGGNTGLYAIPTEPVRVGHVNNGAQGDRIYDSNGKSCAITANGGGTGGSGQGLYATPAERDTKHPIYEVKDGFITIKDRQYPIRLPDGFYIIRKLSVTECCRLQTLPDDYCRAVSDSRAYKGLGGGGQQRSLSTSSKEYSKMCRETRKSLSSPCMTESAQADIALRRWGSRTSNITHTRLTPMR